MRNLLTLCFFSLLLMLPMNALADCSYPGSFSLEGTMGNGINFQIHAAFWGDNPCLVVGETVYLRPNGKTSTIPLYGQIDDETCYLREIIDGKVCGNFLIEMPGPSELQEIDQLVGRQIKGSWLLNDKEYPFQDVRLQHNTGFAVDDANIDYDSYLHHRKLDYRQMSGLYGNYEIMAGDTLYNQLEIVANCDSVLWHSQTYNGMCDWDVLFSTPGLDQDYFDTRNRCFSPSVDEGEYETIAMDDVLMLYRTNSVPEETDNFIDLRDVYPKLADYVVLHVTSPSATAYMDFDLKIPRTDNQNLKRSIRKWVCQCLGIRNDDGDDYWTMAEQVAQNYLLSTSKTDEGDAPYYRQLLADQKSNKTTKYLTLFYRLTDYDGGLHPSVLSQSITFRKSDGKVMNYSDWFENKESIRSIVDKQMRLQNKSLDFGNDLLPIPQNAPSFDNGCFSFEYQQYEATSSTYELLSCTISAKELMPYLTTEAKKLIK